MPKTRLLQKGKAKGRLTSGENLKHDEMTSYLPDLEANTSRCTGQQHLKDYLFYKKSYGHFSTLGLTKVNGYTFSQILAYNISPTKQLSLIKVLKHRTFLMMILIGIPVG